MFLFNFDRIYREDEPQKEVYETALRKLFKDAVTEEKKSVVFLFGPSRCGKTHILLGKSRMHRGILYRGINDIFSSIDNSFVIYISASLMYNNKAVDLLEMPMSSNKAYKTINDPKDLLKAALQSTFDLGAVIKRIRLQLDHMRSEWGECNLKERSHIAFTIEIMKKVPNNNSGFMEPIEKLKPYSKIILIKLCGNEYALPNSQFTNKERSFATNSFNEISNCLLHSALHTKYKGKNKVSKGTEVLQKYLKKYANHRSRIVFLMCLNPSKERLGDMLPALKFVSRLRKCICQEMEKRKVPSFGVEGEMESNVEVLKSQMDEVFDGQEKRMSKKEFNNWLTQKERQVKVLLDKIEEDLKLNSNDPKLLQRREEVMKLKAKLEQMRREGPRSIRVSSTQMMNTPLSNYESRRTATAPYFSPRFEVESPIEDATMGNKSARMEELKTRSNEKLIRQLEDKVDELRTETKMSNEYFDRFIRMQTAKERDRVEEEMQILELKIKEQQKEQDYNIEELNDYSMKIRKAKNELIDLKYKKETELDKNKRELIELEMRELKSQIAILNDGIEETQRTIDNTIKEREDIVQEIQIIKNECDRELELRNEEIQNITQPANEQILILEKSLEEIQGHYTTQEIEEYKELNRKLKEENIRLVEEFNKRKDENCELKNRILEKNEDYDNKVTVIEQKCEQLFAELQRIHTENAAYKENEREYSRRKDSDIETLRGLESKYQKYKHKKSLYIEEIKELENKVKDLKEAKLQENKRKKEINNRMEEYQQRVN